MDDLKQILISHARRYPAMEPGDAVKLLYQNEFGGGHLIRDEQACLDRLRKEYESVLQFSAPLTEEIGNGLVRIHLAALDANGYSVEALGQDFIRSAALHRGNMDSFLRKLELLVQLTEEGGLPFTPQALAAYLESYKQAGCPMVSHSPAYRQAYHPAYRVLRKDCANIPE